MPATVFLYETKLHIVTTGGRFEATHRRRTKLLALGADALKLPTEITHRDGRLGDRAVGELYRLLERHGDGATREAISSAVEKNTLFVSAVRRALRASGRGREGSVARVEGRNRANRIRPRRRWRSAERSRNEVRREHRSRSAPQATSPRSCAPRVAIARPARREGRLAVRAHALRPFSEEIAHRRGTRLTKARRAAHFPFLRTIEEFDFSFQSTLTLTSIGSLLAPDFVTEGRSVIFVGKPGRRARRPDGEARRRRQKRLCAGLPTALTPDVRALPPTDGKRDRRRRCRARGHEEDPRASGRLRREATRVAVGVGDRRLGVPDASPHAEAPTGRSRASGGRDRPRRRGSGHPRARSRPGRRRRAGAERDRDTLIATFWGEAGGEPTAAGTSGPTLRKRRERAIRWCAEAVKLLDRCVVAGAAHRGDGVRVSRARGGRRRRRGARCRRRSPARGASFPQAAAVAAST